MKFTRTLIALSAATLMATSAMAMEPAEYKAAKDQISADHKANKQKCDALQGNAKDVCQKEAKGAEKVAKAELEARYKPSDKTAYKARAAAKPADNTAAKQADVAEARKDAAAEKNEANYKAAKERCDALSGDAKSKCVDDAKRVHGQN